MKVVWARFGSRRKGRCFNFVGGFLFFFISLVSLGCLCEGQEGAGA